jgi:hypothetical protein
MKRARLLFAVLGATVATLGPGAAQRAELPAGPNREIVSRECQACHDLAMVIAATGLSREGWNATIDEMISYGMSVGPEDRAKILDYLSSYLGSLSAPNPAAR